MKVGWIKICSNSNNFTFGKLLKHFEKLTKINPGIYENEFHKTVCIHVSMFFLPNIQVNVDDNELLDAIRDFGVVKRSDIEQI